MRNIKILLIILGFVSLFLIFMAFLINAPSKTTNNPTKGELLSTPSPTKGEAVSTSVSTGQETIGNDVGKSIGKGRLIKKLPYQGSFFSLSYDYGADSFTLVISKDNSASGSAEADGFLKYNQLDGVSSLGNVTTTYK